MRKRRLAGRVSPSMAVAFIALLLALTGASYAAVKLPARSVGARELKPKAVTRAAIKANAVDGSKVAANALTAIVAYLFMVGEIKRVELQEL